MNVKLHRDEDIFCNCRNSILRLKGLTEVGCRLGAAIANFHNQGVVTSGLKPRNRLSNVIKALFKAVLQPIGGY